MRRKEGICLELWVLSQLRRISIAGVIYVDQSDHFEVGEGDV
jgi:hypothetical protein